MKKCTKCKKLKENSDFFVDKRRGLTSLCKTCINENNSRWNDAHPEKKREYIRKSAIKNREKRIAYGKQYRLDNLQKERERNKKYDKSHRELKRKQVRERYARNPEKFQEYHRNRRARIARTGGRITAEEWRALKEFYGFACLKCGKKEPSIQLTLDHVIPISCGGKNMISNAQCLCRSCNSSKGTRHIDYRPVIFSGQASFAEG